MFYRIAALTRGVFVNPALTEPFGLTLIEAAASGLPIVATEDGGSTLLDAYLRREFALIARYGEWLVLWRRDAPSARGDSGPAARDGADAAGQVIPYVREIFRIDQFFLPFQYFPYPG